MSRGAGSKRGNAPRSIIQESCTQKTEFYDLEAPAKVGNSSCLWQSPRYLFKSHICIHQLITPGLQLILVVLGTWQTIPEIVPLLNSLMMEYMWMVPVVSRCALCSL
ncbi:hypothetical protein BT96DRAFT_104698 [Gymnopus androsaceus JB14]|uniref:Uncharacterized protein n=1 Tax=Gymnopus androsaceus JB14 TaxID=1447944 RepID=A0A6A4IAB0_9AGAR|nr:hypothetical protein BT96DRAFT_104698 [Gymnopus androsaceus JB14]